MRYRHYKGGLYELVCEAKRSLVERDVEKAESYFATAFSRGELQAANDAAVMYAAIGRYKEAYSWSVRCVAPFVRTQERVDNLYVDTNLTALASKMKTLTRESGR